MKATGIIRHIDDLCRISLPREILKSMKIQIGDPVEVYVTDEGIVLAKYRDSADTKEKFAKKWLADNDHYIKFYKARFTIEETTVTCEIIMNGQREYGVATCSPHDTFDASIGMVIALCKAAGAPVPEELKEGDKL